MDDPIINELRHYRNEHAEKFAYDLDAICEDYKSHQIGAGIKLVRLQPNMLNKAMPQKNCGKDSLADR